MNFWYFAIVIYFVMLAVRAEQKEGHKFRKEMEDWNAWAEKNQGNKKFKVKKYKPKAQTIGMKEQVGGIEAMRFLHMYRSNHGGEIPEKINLFKEFFLRADSIERKHFERLSVVWLKRQHYELITGSKYVEQDHVIKKLERQNARKFANEEIRSLPFDILVDEMEVIFGDQEKFSLVQAAHWLVDGNLYAEIGPQRLARIFKDDVKSEIKNIVEPSEQILIGDMIDEDQISEDIVDKIDL